MVNVDVGDKILKRLGGFVEALAKKEPISERFTCRTVELKLEPQAYSPALVKQTREILGVSQALFAQFLGASVKTVSAWERGAKTPNDMACRFMDEIRLDPKYWRGRLGRSMTRKREAHRV